MIEPVILGDCTLYRGDCLEVLPTLTTGIVNVVFADPPFNVGKNYRSTKDNMSSEEYKAWCDCWISWCFNAIQRLGTFYLMTLDRHLEWLLPIMARNGIYINIVHWRNVAANHTKRQFWISTQPIVVYGKTDEYLFNTYGQTRKIKNENLRWGGYSTGPKGQLLDYWDDIPFVYAGSISHPEAIIKADSNEKEHPAQMPIGLPKRATLFSTNIGDTVLDPFMGIGTTGVACVQTGRKFIGIEIDPHYFNIAVKRIKEAQLQIRMEI